MALSPGARLGPYEILAPLGAGGMGEVYRAKDTKLVREVAVKVLREGGPVVHRLHRFQREARLASSLNHPGIVSIHEIGHTDACAFIVMELVEGRTLRDLIRSEHLPVKKCLEIGAQVAAALAKAHEAGVVHRDLKPQNIMVTSDGYAKILDFGLAKLYSRESDASEHISQLETAEGLTADGAIIGTFGYMSPEQARGKDVDWRTDQFSFGILLYEALTGTNPFKRDSVAETLNAVIKEEPPPLALEEPFIPTPLQWVVERCIAKNPGERYHSSHDLARDLQTLRDRQWELSSRWTAAGVDAAPTAKRQGGHLAPWFLVGLMAMACIVLLWRAAFRAVENPKVTRLAVSIPPPRQLVTTLSSPLALSPDGRLIAYIAAVGKAKQLYVRDLGSYETHRLPGTDGAVGPFFSPDGTRVGFWTPPTLRTVGLAGGPPRTIATPRWCMAATWGRSDTIVFQKSISAPLAQVPAQGGEPRGFTLLYRTAGESVHTDPQFVAGGRAVIFTVLREKVMGGQKTLSSAIAVKEVNGEGHRILIEDAASPRYAATGHIVFNRGGVLLAVPFDTEALKLSGEEFPVLEGVAVRDSFHAQYDISHNGTLAYVPGEATAYWDEPRRLAWVDRRGATKPISGTEHAIGEATLSNDGHYAVASILDKRRRLLDIWAFDLRRHSWTRISFGGDSSHPIVEPGGSRVLYVSRKEGRPSICSAPMDGSGPEEVLLKGEEDDDLSPDSVSGDEKWLAYTLNGDVWLLDLQTRDAQPLIDTDFYERGAALSPDGRWLAYESTESGRLQIYVRPFRRPGHRATVSIGGGKDPKWSRDSRELYFQSRDDLMAVTVGVSDTISLGSATKVFDGDGYLSYDVAPDGRLLVVQTTGERADSVDHEAGSQIDVVLNWFEELRRLDPNGRN